MFSLKNYFIPIDVIAYEFLRFVSYFELDNILFCFNLSPKEVAYIKYKIYKSRLSVTKLLYDTKYFMEGKLHREDGPAVEGTDGTKIWVINGILHREDGPAVVSANGDKKWYLNNGLHRIGGPAIEYANGDKEWHLHGVRHNFNGPAIEKIDGYKEWRVNGQLHRLGGPALEYANGISMWFREGKHVYRIW